jgi:hypothetical protein
MKKAGAVFETNILDVFSWDNSEHVTLWLLAKNGKSVKKANTYFPVGWQDKIMRDNEEAPIKFYNNVLEILQELEWKDFTFELKTNEIGGLTLAVRHGNYEGYAFINNTDDRELICSKAASAVADVTQEELIDKWCPQY